MRVTSPAVTIKDIWDALVASYVAAGSFGKLLNDNLDAPVSGAKADLTTLETRLSAARATKLDNLDATVSSRLASAAYTAERGTDGAALASAWTAALATVLGNFTAARIGYLDNIDSSLKELFYEHFGVEVDDLPDVGVSGTSGTPANAIDNGVGTTFTHSAVNQYTELDFKAPTYIKKLRMYGIGGQNAANRFKVEAYVDGAWADCETDIPIRTVASWGSWITFTTPRTAILWRFTITTYQSTAAVGELEFHGVRIGA